MVIEGLGVWRVATSGSVTVGDLSAFLMLISRFYVRLDSMSRMLANTQRAAASSYRIFEILDRIPSVSEPVKPQHPGRLSGRLNVIDLSFKYGNRKVYCSEIGYLTYKEIDPDFMKHIQIGKEITPNDFYKAAQQKISGLFIVVEVQN